MAAASPRYARFVLRARGPASGPIHRLLAWVLTGPVGHFLAGALDFAGALSHYARARRRNRSSVGR